MKSASIETFKNEYFGNRIFAVSDDMIKLTRFAKKKIITVM